MTQSWIVIGGRSYGVDAVLTSNSTSMLLSNQKSSLGEGLAFRKASFVNILKKKPTLLAEIVV